MFFARTPLFMLAWGLMYRGCKARVAASAAPSTSDHKALVGLRKLEKLVAGFVVEHNRSDRNFQDQALAVASALRRVFGIKAEMHQRVVPLAGLHHDVAALAPVAAGRSAARDELLPPEGHATVPAISRFNPNFGFIDEH